MCSIFFFWFGRFCFGSCCDLSSSPLSVSLYFTKFDSWVVNVSYIINKFVCRTTSLSEMLRVVVYYMRTSVCGKSACIRRIYHVSLLVRLVLYGLLVPSPSFSHHHHHWSPTPIPTRQFDQTDESRPWTTPIPCWRERVHLPME